MNTKQFREIQMGPQPGGLSPATSPQMIIPFGKWDTAKYGVLDFNADYCAQIVKHFNDRVMGNRVPFVDVDHDRGEAQGWIKSLEVREDGLYASIEWTAPGVLKVSEKRYRYFSADIAPVKEITTGNEYFPVLVALALTNTPVLNVLPDVQLSEALTEGKIGSKITATSGDSTHGDGAAGKITLGGSNVNFEQLIAFLKENGKSLTPDQRKLITDALGISAEPEGEMAALKKQAEESAAKCSEAEKKLAEAKAAAGAKGDLVIALSERISKLETASTETVKKNAIERALSEGRIKPADRAVWEQRFSEAPKVTLEVLELLPIDPAFTASKGTAKSNEGFALSDELYEVGRQMGYSREQYAEIVKKYGA